MQQWYVYLLRCVDNSLYCGITTDMQRRLLEHNGYKKGGAKYTKGRRPVELCACAPCENRGAASRAEAFVRTLPKKEKIAAIQAMCIQIHNYEEKL